MKTNLLTFLLGFAALASPIELAAQERHVSQSLASLPLEAQSSISAQLAKLTASDGAAFDYLGYSAAIDGDTVVVGAPPGDDRCESHTRRGLCVRQTSERMGQYNRGCQVNCL